MATEQLARPHRSPPVPENDRMPVHGIDHVEFYVGNAAQAAYYFTHAFGFTRRPTAGSRPAIAAASRTCSSRVASGSCSPGRSAAATRSPITTPATATASTRSP